MKISPFASILTVGIGLAISLFSAEPAAERNPPGANPSAALSFQTDGKGFRFDTGFLKGRLHEDGRSIGLSEVTVAGMPEPVSQSMGWLSLYRLLDDHARYGGGAWDWASEARLADGGVETAWQADAAHPFDLTARYAWARTNAMDITVTVRAREDLRGFEVFLANYFKGFDRAFVRTREGGLEQFVEAKERDATWHIFPRGEEVVRLIQDGRWKREPNPVDWTVRPALAMPLAMRQDTTNRLTAVLMAPAADCFAVATPFGAEAHRSLYLSLFGKDLARGASATARARLVIGRLFTQEQVVGIYRDYLQSLAK